MKNDFINNQILIKFINMKIKFTFFIVVSWMALITSAQETKILNSNISIGVDFASMYLWRGFELGNGPAIQPWGEFSYKGFTLGAWGSYEFTGEFKEVDLYSKYTYKDLSLLFVDLFLPDYEGLDLNFFNFKNKTTGHISELALSFNGTEKIPFSLYGGVILYGIPIDHKVNGSNASNYSSYFEVNYLGKLKDYSYNLFVGFTPTESYLYATEKFSVFNVGLSAKKSIKITEDFGLPVKLTIASNPVSEKIFMALLISL